VLLKKNKNLNYIFVILLVLLK